MNEPIDLLQIKIDKAKSELPEATRKAIEAVDWKSVILTMRQTKGYSFEQLGDLEIETELMLVGITSPEDYPKELENRMKISKSQVDVLVNDMNMQVFSKIREELIKNIERSNASANRPITTNTPNTTEQPAPQIKKEEMQVLHQAGIKIVEPDLTVPELNSGKTHPVFAQKFSTTVQAPVVKTEHEQVVVKPETPEVKKSYPKGGDPYRLAPGE